MPNVNANQIKLFPQKLLECLDLEEINMVNIGLAGDIGQGIVNLTKLRFLNLSYNSMEGVIPDNPGWINMINLEIVEL